MAAWGVLRMAAGVTRSKPLHLVEVVILQESMSPWPIAWLSISFPLGKVGMGPLFGLFTANGGFLILFLVSLPSGGRGGGWWRISESMLSGISATARRRIGQSPEKEQNFLYHVHDSTLLYIGHTAPKERNTKSLGIF